MMKWFEVAVVLLAGTLTVAGARAGDKPGDQGASDHADVPPMPAHDDDAHDQGRFAFGEPGDARKVDRTIRIRALDTMRYDEQKLTVRAGETVRFVVTDAGKIRHEGMVMPDEANGISLAPGETKSIVWHFAGPGTVEFACHEPGHFEAGMVGRILVKK